MGWLWANPFCYENSKVCISIPLWDDCESNPFCYENSKVCISIPLWDDCEKERCYGNLYFYYISIPLWDDCENPTSHIRYCFVPYFNSTMGWLWVEAPIYLNNLKIFQFHYGMIVSVKKRYRLTYENAFQFHYGMIVRIIQVNWGFQHNFISIPLWDDCEWKSGTGWHTRTISIPLWDDCEIQHIY